MTRKGESSRIEALEALIAEKRKHEGYLAKLDERREGTPENVYTRLRDEYLTKLTDAQVRAHAEAESIAEGLAEDESAVGEVDERLSALHEERLEGELRAAVGELDPKEWAKKLTALNASISMAEKDRDARLSVVERTRELLAEAGALVSDSGSGGGKAAVAPGDAPKTPGMTGAPSFDELAFLNSVVGRASAGAAPPPRASKPVEQVKADAAPKESATADPPRAPEKTPARSSTPASSAAPVRAEPPAAAASVPETPEAKEEPLVVEPAAAEVKAAEEEETDDAFGRPTPRTSQAVKTLKCQECGTFNFPTEWYCERCGGELAAL